MKREFFFIKEFSKNKTLIRDNIDENVFKSRPEIPNTNIYLEALFVRMNTLKLTQLFLHHLT